MHSLVKTPFHKQKRVPSEQVRDRTGVTRLEQLAFVLEDEPVGFRVSGEHGRFAEHVGREDGSEPGNPVVDEGIWVFRLVGGDEVEGLAEEGETEGARRESEVAARDDGGAEEDED